MTLLHPRLLLLPQCRCALPASMALSRAFSHTHASSSLSRALPGSVVGNPNWRFAFWGFRVDDWRVLGLQRSFTSRRFSRVEKSRAVLAEVGYTEETDVQLTDSSAQPGDQGLKSMPGSNIVLTAGADVGRLAIVKSAEFIKSSSNAQECPGEGFPEIALVGRSNVGKSSLINSLVRRKELAQTSKKPGHFRPFRHLRGNDDQLRYKVLKLGDGEILITESRGKTQLINHFLINKKWYLVDLPGYGFAKAPTAIRTDWNEFTKEYFLKRETLICVLLLVDSSIEPQQIDLDCIDWLGRKKIPLTIVFTKCDRKKKKKNGGRKPEENIKDFLEKLKPLFAEMPPWIMTSSETHQGREELLRHIAQLRIFWAS